MGKVIGIATRTKTRAPMEEHTSAKVSFDRGVGEDSRGLIKGNRQVTVLTQEGWNAACTALDQQIHWTTRRANILVTGLDLERTKGALLKIGNLELEITGELVPCNRMDEQVDGLTKALEVDWRGGVTCKIISEGSVHINDEVTLEEKP